MSRAMASKHILEAARTDDTLIEGFSDVIDGFREVKLNQAADREARISMLSDWASLEQTEFDSRDRAAELGARLTGNR